MGLLKYGGLAPAYFLLRFVSLYFFLFSGHSFRHSYDFYRRGLQYGRMRSFFSVYRNYYAFGQVLVDRTAVMAGFRTRLSYTFEGEQHLRKMADEGKGALLISAHMGNFEMAGHMLRRLDHKTSIVMYDAEHEQIRQYMSQVISKSFDIIVLKDDNSHIYAIRSAMENGDIICMHGDRYLKGSKVVQCPFLGREAYFPAGPFYLSLRNAIPVSFVFAMKESRYRYHFYATRPRLYNSAAAHGRRNEAIRQITGDFVSEMEKMVRQYPHQWFNFHDLWAENEN